jgi:hypothetical protein
MKLNAACIPSLVTLYWATYWTLVQWADGGASTRVAGYDHWRPCRKRR